ILKNFTILIENASHSGFSVLGLTSSYSFISGIKIDFNETNAADYVHISADYLTFSNNLLVGAGGYGNGLDLNGSYLQISDNIIKKTNSDNSASMLKVGCSRSVISGNNFDYAGREYMTWSGSENTIVGNRFW